MGREVCINGEKGRMCIDIQKFIETGKMEFELREKF